MNFCIAAIYIGVLKNLLVQDTKKTIARKSNSMRKERNFALNCQRCSTTHTALPRVQDVEDPSLHKSSTTSNI